MEGKPTAAHRPFGMRDNLAYAAGDFGCNMSFALKGTLVIFWTQYMGRTRCSTPRCCSSCRSGTRSTTRSSAR